MDVSEEQIIEYIKYILWFVFGSGIVLEITPMKIKPVSAFLRWLGKKLNGEVRKDILQLEGKVDEIQGDLQQHKVESWRRDILDFSERLYSGDVNISRESYENIIEIHNNYDVYLAKHNICNGKVDMAYEHILLNYRDKRDNGGFDIQCNFSGK